MVVLVVVDLHLVDQMVLEEGSTGEPFPGTIGATPANGYGNDGGAGPDGGANGGGGGGGGGAGGLGINGGGGSSQLVVMVVLVFNSQYFQRSRINSRGSWTNGTNGDTSGKYWLLVVAEVELIRWIPTDSSWWRWTW